MFLLKDHNGETGGANVLLSTDVDKIEFLPVNFAGSKVGAHVAHDELASRDNIPGELVELKALDSLILAEMEESCFLFDVPFAGILNSRVSGILVVGHFLSIAEFLGFLNGSLRPGTSSHIVSGLNNTFTEEVLANSGELLRSTTLEEHDFVSFGYAHQSAEIAASCLSNFSKIFGPVAHLHDRDARTLPAH